ncbi:unnamed protein product [Blepharisma stoltei]|uniref:Protein YIPF n=1 Tax=Blepharisma stoltei TaxID=1481888 RepID=A0AAU9JB04_9CILI|nr:unnamed protein product [Blepharisma stoltei]
MEKSTYQKGLLQQEDLSINSDGIFEFDRLFETKPKENYKCWQVKYYRPYFNVDTRTVFHRIFISIIPIAPSGFFGSAKPDAYGPFWIATTVIFMLCAFGNIESAINYNTIGPHLSNFLVAASIIYGLLVAFPLISCCLLSNVGFIYLVSLYGYSFSLYLFILPICIFTSQVVRIVLTLSAGLWSMGALIKNLVSENNINGKLKAVIAAMLFLGEVSIVLVTNLVFFK